MAIKQRYQNIILGDTVRLQNFLLDNSAEDSIVAMVPKVEIYRKKPSHATDNNPRGLTLKKTLVHRAGQSDNQITATPSASNPDFWELNLDIHPDMWEVDNDPAEEHVDRWYLILDPNADLARPVKVAPYSQSDALDGVKPVNIDHVEESITVGSGVGPSYTDTIAVRPGLEFAPGDVVRFSREGGDVYVDALVAIYNTSNYLLFRKFRHQSGGHALNTPLESWVMGKLERQTIGTITATLNPAVGSKTITVQPGMGININDFIELINQENPEYFMLGKVESYSGTTLVLDVVGSMSSPDVGPTQNWNVFKVGDSYIPVVKYRTNMKKNRFVKPSGISTASSVFSVAEVSSDLESQRSFFSGQLFLEEMGQSGESRVYTSSRDHEIVPGGVIATAADAAALNNNVVAGQSYAMFGRIFHENNIVGFFHVAYNTGLQRQAVTIFTTDTPAAITPVEGVYELTLLPSGNLSPSLPIVWSEDPETATSLQGISYNRAVVAPPEIKNAISLGIVGSIVQYTDPGKPNDRELLLSHLSLNSNDNGATWNGTVFSGDDNRATDAYASYDSQSGNLDISVQWNLNSITALPDNTKLKAFYVEEWNTSIPYKSGEPNAWDDIVLRTHPTMLQIVEHSFRINPSMYISSTRPIVVDWNFSAVPNNYYINTRTWMRVTITPDVPLNPETLRWHYGLLSAGKLRYQVYRLSVDGQDSSRMISSGTIDWFEKNVGLWKIDTRQPPFNRGQSCFIVFFVDLADGTQIRSGRIFFNIIDDLRRGVLIASGPVF